MSYCIIWIFMIVMIGTLINFSETASPPEKSCRLVLTDFNRMRFQEISICSKSYKSSKERVQKSACILKCVLQNMGLINSAGTLSMDQYDHYIKEQFPASLQNRANATFIPCLKLIEGKIFNATSAPTDQEDLLCKSYEPFIKCISLSSFRLCKDLAK